MNTLRRKEQELLKSQEGHWKEYMDYFCLLCLHPKTTLMGMGSISKGCVHGSGRWIWTHAYVPSLVICSCLYISFFPPGVEVDAQLQPIWYTMDLSSSVVVGGIWVGARNLLGSPLWDSFVIGDPPTLWKCPYDPLLSVHAKKDNYWRMWVETSNGNPQSNYGLFGPSSLR